MDKLLPTNSQDIKISNKFSSVKILISHFGKNKKNKRILLTVGVLTVILILGLVAATIFAYLKRDNSSLNNMPSTIKSSLTNLENQDMYSDGKTTFYYPKNYVQSNQNGLNLIYQNPQPNSTLGNNNISSYSTPPDIKNEVNKNFCIEVGNSLQKNNTQEKFNPSDVTSSIVNGISLCTLKITNLNNKANLVLVQKYIQKVDNDSLDIYIDQIAYDNTSSTQEVQNLYSALNNFSFNK